MASARPTAGPWTVTQKTDGWGWQVSGPSPNRARADDPLRWLIAETVSNEATDEANARLIAAAPELLAALITIEAGEDCGCSHDSPDCCAVVGVYCPRCIAAAAIAKAEGRS